MDRYEVKIQVSEKTVKSVASVIEMISYSLSGIPGVDGIDTEEIMKDFPGDVSISQEITCDLGGIISSALPLIERITSLLPGIMVNAKTLIASVKANPEIRKEMETLKTALKVTVSQTTQLGHEIQHHSETLTAETSDFKKQQMYDEHLKAHNAT